MNNFILWVWIIILISSVVRRFASRSIKEPSRAGAPAKPRTADPVTAQAKKPVRVPSPEAQGNRVKRFRKANTADATCETQYGHVHPERGEQTMRFAARPDLEAGYMYLNGVKVLIKEADRLEFLR